MNLFRLVAYGALFYGTFVRDYPIMAASGWFILLSRLDDVDDRCRALLMLNPEYRKKLEEAKAEREKA